HVVAPEDVDQREAPDHRERQEDQEEKERLPERGDHGRLLRFEVHLDRPGAAVVVRHPVGMNEPTGVQLEMRLRRNPAMTSVPMTVRPPLPALRPRGFASPPARAAMFTGTSSSFSPASAIRISASTSGAAVENGFASSGKAFALTA